MPQLSPIVLNDGVSDTTYTPAVVNNTGTSVLTDNAAANYGVRGKVSVSSAAISGNSGGRRVELRIEEPRVITDSSTGVVSAQETETIAISFTARPNGSKPDRAKLRAKAISLLGHATITTMMDDLEGVW